jgi:IS1 family transposase
MPTKNAAVCLASRAPLASRVRPSQVGSKKRSSASSFVYNPARPGSRRSHFHDLGTGRTDGSFVLKKAHDSWMWIALCRKTRQVIAYAVGDRSKRTCQRLWEAIPEGYRQGHCFTDFWAAHVAIIPEEQHSAVGKETGGTAHCLLSTPACCTDRRNPIYSCTTAQRVHPSTAIREGSGVIMERDTRTGFFMSYTRPESTREGA